MAVWDHATRMQTSLSPLLWQGQDSLAESAPWACSLVVGMVSRGDRNGLGHLLTPGDAKGCSHPLHLCTLSLVYFWELNPLALGMASDKRCNMQFRKETCHCGSVNKWQTFVKIAPNSKPLKDRYGEKRLSS